MNLNLNMNYKQQQKISGGVPSNTAPQTGNFLQRRTLFEGRVPGPMRFEELVKGHDYDQKEGDQEILLMERNNSKLTFYKGSPQQNNPTTMTSTLNNAVSHNNSLTHNTSVIRQHQSRDALEHQRLSEMDRYGLAYYSQQHSCTATNKLTEGVTGRSSVSSYPQPPWTQSNDGSFRNFNSPGYIWSTGQMEVSSTNNVQSQQKVYPSSQIPSEYKIPKSYSSHASPESETKKQVYQPPDFTAQQLNNHHKSFKYIKQSQQQSKTMYQTGNSMSMAYHSPPQDYINANLPNNSSATITKLAQVPPNPSRSYFEGMHPGGSHGVGIMGNNMKSISTTSRANFKQKQPQISNSSQSPRVALEHYEKLRKYWDYQHHLLIENSEQRNYCNSNNYNAMPMNYGINEQPVSVNWQHNKNNFIQARGATGPGAETTLDIANFHQTSQQTSPYSISQISTTAHNQQIKMPTDPQSTPIRGASGFAAELEKLQNYHFTHGQQRREWSWPYTSKAPPPTPAQKKTYPNSNSYHDAARRTYVQQFYKPVEMLRKENSSTTERIEKMPQPPVPPSTPNNESGMETFPSPQRRSIIQSITEDVQIVDFVDSTKSAILARHHAVKREDNESADQGQREVVQFPKQEIPEKSLTYSRPPETTPTDLSLTHRRSDQDQMLLLNRRIIHQSPPSPQRSKSVGGVTDVAGYDHIVLLDKRVQTYMCKRCLEPLKSDQEIRNHLFCLMLKSAIQCSVCSHLFPCEDYQSHLKGHGVRAFSN